ncbi:toll/interleukin-1 receptor domain-containing protein [Sphingobium sp. MK2]|uniref:toll/interleukin-1 receptor domain-containing protein n=1 Tax=Sphingobium sp. MK2 TaxID=3116540 RepID=UPI00386A9C34
MTDPIRAFLSHATSDKAFVEKVAEQLGRAAVVFDAFEFATGDDLKQAILSGLDKAEIFVLFASRAALSSPSWTALAERAVNTRS